jgi:hypothetical protein
MPATLWKAWPCCGRLGHAVGGGHAGDTVRPGHAVGGGHAGDTVRVGHAVGGGHSSDQVLVNSAGTSIPSGIGLPSLAVSHFRIL